MKIAFDVQGTLLGPDKVLKLYKWCEKKGHDLTVWSNCYGYTEDAIKSLSLGDNAKPMSKVYRLDNNNEDIFDIAVDDKSQYSELLAAKKIVLVEDIPENEELFESIIK